MYDEQLAALLSDTSATNLAHLEPDCAQSPQTRRDPAQEDPVGPPSGDQQERDDLAPAEGIFLAVILSSLFWIIAGAVTLWMLMG